MRFVQHALHPPLLSGALGLWLLAPESPVVYPLVVVGMQLALALAEWRAPARGLEESNTNYGCAALLWGPVFGTFSASPTAEAGIGPPEPADSQIAPWPLSSRPRAAAGTSVGRAARPACPHSDRSATSG